MNEADQPAAGAGSVPAEIEQQLDRICGSAEFQNAPRMQHLLRYVVGESLTGRAKRLKGYTIALAVFGRDEAFDPQTDSIVRVEAGRLRRLLKAYYLDEGCDEPIRIEIPKGTYVPKITALADLSQTPGAQTTPELHAKTAQQAPALSIAVLPFDNLSGEPEMDYFADGLTEDVITAATQLLGSKVIARNTVFRYKGQAVDIKTAGRELGVRYILEGSVRKSGKAVRFVAQLVDAATGEHVCADRCDYELGAGEILEIQAAMAVQVHTQLARALDIPLNGDAQRSVNAAGQETVVAAMQPEQRQLTVMACGLVDFAALAGRMDPENLLNLLGDYRRNCEQVINSFGGFIAKYEDGNTRVYFGYPQAHEDDAERAMRAGLSLINAVGNVQTVSNLSLQIRVGIATGTVLIGDLGEGKTAEKDAVVGQAPGAAAYLQTLAEPNAVVIGPRTHRLAGATFEYKSLGSHEIKGFAEPMRVWQVLRPTWAESRFAASHTMLTPLVGRNYEIALLTERWQQAQDGEGQVVLLSGEPGIGKSRLTEALMEHVAHLPHSRLRYQCLRRYTNSALSPVIHQLEHAAQFTREDAPAAKLGKLETVLSQATNDVSKIAPLFAALLGVPGEGRYPPLKVTPEKQKVLTFEALLTQLEGLSTQDPVLVIFEDLHWVDPTTLELLGQFIDRIQRLPVLLVATFRPEFDPPWGEYPHVTMLTLNRLARRQGVALIKTLTKGKALPAEVAKQILAKTDGVPLFVEELTQAVLESGLLEDKDDHYMLTEPLPALAIPDTLHDSLMARLDHLAPIKEVAQSAAIIGREFSYALLAAVSPLPEDDLQGALRQIVEAGLMFRHGSPPQATYTFKHALIQDTAYQSVLRSKRRQLHARIAKVLEERLSDIADTEPEVLAHHYTEAALTEPAIRYWEKAGQHAVRQSANVEATQHYVKAIELLGKLAATSETQQKEVELQIALGGVHLTTQGFTGHETRQAFNRANELCNQLGDTALVMPALYGIADAYFVGGQLEAAHEVSYKYFALAERSEETGDLIRAHDLEGFILLFMGDVMEARGHFEQCLKLYNREQHGELKFQYGYDPAADAMGFLSVSLWLLGYPDQALHKSQEAIHLGREIAHAPSLVNAQIFASSVHGLRRELQKAQGLTEEIIETCSHWGFEFWQTHATIMHGWSLSQSGGGHEGVRELRQGIIDRQETGAMLGLPFFLGLLVEAIATTGDAQEALSVLNKGLALADKHNECWYEPELYRLKGELLLAQGATKAEVADFYKKALALARERSMKSLELRTTMSLARLWRTQRKNKQARELLADVYDWFTEGFETDDLKEAKQLLDEL